TAAHVGAVRRAHPAGPGQPTRRGGGARQVSVAASEATWGRRPAAPSTEGHGRTRAVRPDAEPGDPRAVHRRLRPTRRRAGSTVAAVGGVPPSAHAHGHPSDPSGHGGTGDRIARPTRPPDGLTARPRLRPSGRTDWRGPDHTGDR